MSIRSIRPTLSAIALCFAASGQVQAAPVALDVGTWSGSGCCGSSTRGYWFIAPTDFRITGLSLPSGGGARSTLEVLRMNSAVPQYAGFSNDFSSLGFWSGQASVSTDIEVQMGDIIGVLGFSGDMGLTPYRNASGDYSTQLGGFNISLTRFGFQSTGMAADVWQEVGGTIGVIGMTYDLSAANSVPEPTSLLLSLSALGLLGAAATRRRRAA